MTKTNLFTALGGGDHVADLHLFVTDDDTVNQQFNELSFLFKSCFGYPLLYTLTEEMDRLDHRRQLVLMAHTRFKLTNLPGDGLESLLQFLASSLELIQLKNLGQIGFG